MKIISGRWFLYSPIVIFLLYLGITEFLEWFNCLNEEEAKQVIRIILKIIVLITIIWSSISAIYELKASQNHRKYTKYTLYSPLLIFILIWKGIVWIDSFFHKHLTIKL